MLIHLLAGAFACETPTDVLAVTEALESAEAALETGDGMTFSKAMGGLTSTLECLDALLDPPAVARLYRIRGLDSYVSGRNDAAARWFSAARRIDPGATLPIYPAVHEIQNIYTELDPRQADLLTLPRPKHPLWIDGTETRTFPVDLPTFVQQKSGEGWSADLLPARQEPMYPRRRPVRVSLAIVSGLTAAAAVTTWAASSSAKRSVDGPNQTVDQLRGHQRRANTTGALAITFGALSAASATGAVLTSR